MPSFDFDIDVEEFFWSLSKREKQDLIDLIKEDKQIARELAADANEPRISNMLDAEWADVIEKLYTKRHCLTFEEEQIIHNIAKRL